MAFNASPTRRAACVARLPAPSLTEDSGVLLLAPMQGCKEAQAIDGAVKGSKRALEVVASQAVAPRP